MLKRLALTIALISSVTAAHSQPLVRQYGMDGGNSTSAVNPFPVASPGLPLSAGTSTNVTVTTASQIVTLNGLSTNVTINNTHATNTLYFQPFGTTASTANFPIAAGQAFTWSTAPGISQFALYASGSATVAGILAH